MIAAIKTEIPFTNSSDQAIVLAILLVVEHHIPPELAY